MVLYGYMKKEVKKETEKVEKTEEKVNEQTSEKKENSEPKKEDSKEVKKDTPTTNDKKDQKKKKKHKFLKLTTRNIVELSIVIVISSVIGAGAGYLFYTNNNTASSSLSGYATEGNVLSIEEMEKKLAKNTNFESEYKDKAYELINYSLHKQASYSYALTIGKASAVAAGYTQNIVSSTFVTPDCVYNQNVSSSSLVHTANRFYDYNDEKVECYLKSTPDQWQNSDNVASEYSYDEYMQKYGKLLQPSYYCLATTNTAEITEDKPIADRFLTLKEEDYKKNNDSTKHHVNGVVIYMIGPSTVKSSSIEKTSTGYLLKCDLYCDADIVSGKSKGCSYYSVQMRTTGGLSKRPPFNKSHLEFNVDSNFELVSSYFEDEYVASMSVLNITTTTQMTQYYFHSNDSTFNGVEVSIPKYNDPDNFAGYNLFPNS